MIKVLGSNRGTSIVEFVIIAPIVGLLVLKLFFVIVKSVFLYILLKFKSGKYAVPFLSVFLT